MEVVKFLLKNLNRISSYWEWLKWVVFYDKTSMLAYKENQMNKRFNQYYKFLEALKNYKIINIEEYRKSIEELLMEQILQHKKLVKSTYSDKLEDMSIKKVN